MAETRRQAMRRHVGALSTTARQLRAQLESPSGGGSAKVRRGGVAGEWLDRLRAEGAAEASLVRGPDGTQYVLEGDRRRRIGSGLLARGLAGVLGDAVVVSEAELAATVEGVPVEVLEAPSGQPFVVVGGRRLPLKGLPVPYPVSAEDARLLPMGRELDLAATVASRRQASAPPSDGASGEPATTDVPAGPGAREAGAGEPEGATTEPEAGGGEAVGGEEPTTAASDGVAPTMVPELPLPTFLIIGAQKCATRWLRMNLGRHPEVFVAPEEGVFFHTAQSYERGLDWYRGRFEGWRGEPLVGESTPGYMMWRHHPDTVAARIGQELPDVRLIATLRDPVDRAYSAMRHHIVKGRLDEDADLLDLVRRVPPTDDPFGLVAGGWYAASLEPYLERFGDQLLVLIVDDPSSDLASAFDEALEHVGLTAGFRPPELERVRFSNAAHLGDQAGPELDERRRLYEFFEDDIAHLEELLGRDLSHWSPARR